MMIKGNGLLDPSIYQYVGDEIIVSWNYSNAFENNNCLRAFYEIQKTIDEKSSRYLQKYNLIPTFKAGLHCGTVISGEIGQIKRDIAYSGDVLNTAARIQSKCNELGADLLFSKKVYEQLDKEANIFRIDSVGNIELRGKAEPLKLYTAALRVANS